jgi:hypothetical protein
VIEFCVLVTCVLQEFYFIFFQNIVSKFSETNLQPSWPMTVWVSLFSKNHNFFCMNSDGDKLYMKLIALHEIYNVVVQIFFI